MTRTIALRSLFSVAIGGSIGRPFGRVRGAIAPNKPVERSRPVTAATPVTTNMAALASNEVEGEEALLKVQGTWRLAEGHAVWAWIIVPQSKEESIQE